ncbi:MAG: GFA family protein [Porphyrobacter sp.]|nr:GFA family protein [Porphyrobacter sp.]
MHREGGCACGAIRFSIDAPLLGAGACHCTDCQKLAGGGPNYVALAPKGTVEVTQGEPKLYHRPGESGEDVTRAFCGNCGTPLWSVPASAPFLTIKVGAFDDYSDLAPQMHVYVSSAPSWHSLPADLPTFAKMPPPDVAPARRSGVG